MSNREKKNSVLLFLFILLNSLTFDRFQLKFFEYSFACNFVCFFYLLRRIIVNTWNQISKNLLLSIAWECINFHTFWSCFFWCENTQNANTESNKNFRYCARFFLRIKLEMELLYIEKYYSLINILFALFSASSKLTFCFDLYMKSRQSIAHACILSFSLSLSLAPFLSLAPSLSLLLSISSFRFLFLSPSTLCSIYRCYWHRKIVSIIFPVQSCCCCCCRYCKCLFFAVNFGTSSPLCIVVFVYYYYFLLLYELDSIHFNLVCCYAMSDK